MGLLQRLATTLNAKANELLDRYENPGEALDYAYELELQQMRRVQRAIEHVTALRQRLQLQTAQLRESALSLGEKAREVVTLGRDDLAREALARKIVLNAGIASLSTQENELTAEDDRFIEAERLLEGKLEILRSKKETMKATYAATRAKTEIDTTVSEIRDEVVDIRSAVERAEEKVAQLGARVTAIDELLNSGALHDLERSPELIGVELRQIRGSEEVEHELVLLKRTTTG